MRHIIQPQLRVQPSMAIDWIPFANFLVERQTLIDFCINNALYDIFLCTVRNPGNEEDIEHGTI